MLDLLHWLLQAVEPERSSSQVIDHDVNSLQVGGKSLFYGKNEIS